MPERNPHIRSYAPDSDYPAVRKILEAGDLYYEPMDSAERLAEKIRRDPDSILVAVASNQVLGTVSLMEDGKMPFIFRLAVDPDQRRQGIGRKLMEAAEDILKSRGYKEINILVEEGDHELQEYYLRQSYDRGNPYRWMVKELK